MKYLYLKITLYFGVKWDNKTGDNRINKTTIGRHKSRFKMHLDFVYNIFELQSVRTFNFVFLLLTNDMVKNKSFTRSEWDEGMG